MSPTLTLYNDVPAFFTDVQAHLEAHEAENAMFLGLLSTLAKNPPAEVPFLARLHDGDETISAAYLASLNLIVSRNMSQATGPLIQALLDRRLDIPGIVGLKAEVDPLADAWVQARGCHMSHAVEQMLYQLHTINWPTGIPGRMRPMTDADIDLVTDWILGFHRAALAHEPFSEPAARDNAQARPAQGMTFLWEVEGTPVAMAALARPTQRGISVNAVYTPPEHRRHGYASALVAAVSEEGLRRGKDFCVLYTDLANPTSNAIYQKLGYRQLQPSKNVRFQYA